ncbi:beta-galactosidase 7-like protein [Trifolium pratense]|uniref:Beta-galactosidase 7-like protein n=1 Tax=Trifolium pratense TaxID=57577 RepID=A0A2K3KE04_TRIPR|nr:beta-galactosidase 7-like protein [Trifolium pratense]
MTWYKTSFKTPEGNDSVVLDLLGLTKGEAWINGHSIGRYWPAMIADTNGCIDSDNCDYRGSYVADKCLSGCGEPSQRFYHVPRSFLNKKKKSYNTLILFEEMGGGSPLNVSVQTISIGYICADGSDGKTLELKCPDGKVFSKTEFVSYGDTSGKCGSFERGKWKTPDSVSVVENLCIGKQSCSIDVWSSTFNLKLIGSDGSRLAVQLQCDWYDPKISPEQRVKNLHEELENLITNMPGPGEDEL